MRAILALYVLAGVVIIGIVILAFFRDKIITDYRTEYLNTEAIQPRYIPKKLFQLIADKNKISPQFAKNIAKLRKKNPDFVYRLYDDSEIPDYIQRYYGPEMLDYYNRINPKYGAARADLFRYLLMYREGGVYLDIKSGSHFPLNRIILPDDEYILAHWDLPFNYQIIGNSRGEYQQWHIITRPGHPFLKAVINEVMRNIDNYDLTVGVGKLAVLKVTGPIAYTRAIIPIAQNYPHRLVEINDLIGLVYNDLPTSHINLFSKTHYSKITEPVVIGKSLSQ